MLLRSGRVLSYSRHRVSTKKCGHLCELDAVRKCCACVDKRPNAMTYFAFNQSSINTVSIVERDFYYCPACKSH